MQSVVCHGIAICVFLLCLDVPANATTNVLPETLESIPEYLNMPWEYGEVIYRINPESSKQLFIIGIGHRNPDTGTNSSTTVQTQIDIFRIGTWLNRKLRLNLLLPEGYFTGNSQDTIDSPRSVRVNNTPSLSIPDNSELQERLSATTSFVNAEMLLMKYLPYHASQVEDRKVYNAVRQSLRRVNESAAKKIEVPAKLAKLAYLQEIRTARLLQKIPTVINTAYDNGTIGRRTALFTIGLNHINDIYRYIENQAILITAPSVLDDTAIGFKSSVNLLERGYGITIILPRTLADNQKLLEITNIDKILLTGES